MSPPFHHATPTHTNANRTHPPLPSVAYHPIPPPCAEFTAATTTTTTTDYTRPRGFWKLPLPCLPSQPKSPRLPPPASALGTTAGFASGWGWFCLPHPPPPPLLSSPPRLGLPRVVCPSTARHADEACPPPPIAHGTLASYHAPRYELLPFLLPSCRFSPLALCKSDLLVRVIN
jgi:hypothetical protein